MAQRRVVVTGLGAVTPLGVGVKHVWSSLLALKSGIVSTDTLGDERFNGIPSKVAGVVPKGSISEGKWNVSDHIDDSGSRRMALFSQYAMAAATEAMKDAQWTPSIDTDQEMTGLCIGSGIGGFTETYDHSVMFDKGGFRKVQPLFIPKMLPNMPSGLISIKYGLRGPNHTVSTACATGNHAIGDAFRFIKDDYADVMLAGATEASVHPLALAGFARARSLSQKFNHEPSKASRPFDKDRDGFVLAEGSGILVLEELEHAKKRGAQIYAEIVGYGLSGDGYHITAPAPDGNGAIRSMKRALKGISKTEVDYINAHATSTALGDEIECHAMRTLFEDENTQFHVSSTKGSTGHLLGAAGAIEAIFTILAVKNDICPPTLNLENIGVDSKGLNFVGDAPFEKEINVALSNSFGFGGINTSLTFKKYKETS